MQGPRTSLSFRAERITVALIAHLRVNLIETYESRNLFWLQAYVNGDSSRGTIFSLVHQTRRLRQHSLRQGKDTVDHTITT